MLRKIYFYFILILLALPILGQDGNRDYYKSVVYIQYCVFDEYDELSVVSIGSGTVINKESGLILTNAHVVMEDLKGKKFADVIMVGVTDAVYQPPKMSFYAEVVQVDQRYDIALIKITGAVDGSDITQNDLIESPLVNAKKIEELFLGEEITVIGYPQFGSDTITLTKGNISGFASIPESYDSLPNYIKTDTLIANGNSGGAAFDINNRYIGIPTLIMANASGMERGAADNLGYLRPVNIVEPLIKKYEQFGKINTEGNEMMSFIHFSTEIDENKRAIKPGYTFSGEISKVYCNFDYTGFETGKTYTFEWFFNDTSVVKFTEKWTKKEEGNYYSYIYSNDGDLPAGNYRFTLSIGGVNIGSGETSIYEKKRNLRGRVWGYITNSYTGEVIQNAVVLILKPGVSIKKFMNEQLDEYVISTALSDDSGYYNTIPEIDITNTYSIIIYGDGYNMVAVDNYVNFGNNMDLMIPVSLSR